MLLFAGGEGDANLSCLRGMGDLKFRVMINRKMQNGFLLGLTSKNMLAFTVSVLLMRPFVFRKCFVIQCVAMLAVNIVRAIQPDRVLAAELVHDNNLLAILSEASRLCREKWHYFRWTFTWTCHRTQLFAAGEEDKVAIMAMKVREALRPRVPLDGYSRLSDGPRVEINEGKMEGCTVQSKSAPNLEDIPRLQARCQLGGEKLTSLWAPYGGRKEEARAASLELVGSLDFDRPSDKLRA